MIRVIFKHVNEEKIATINLDLENRKIDNIEVEEERSRIAGIYYPQIKNPSYDSLKTLLNHYCDTENVDLRLLLDNIEKNGFYTPYRPNLRIEIKR